MVNWLLRIWRDKRAMVQGTRLYKTIWGDKFPPLDPSENFSLCTIARTRSFPETDIGSDHDLLMMTFHLRLKRITKPKHTRLKFDLKKLKDFNELETFQANIGGKFAPLTIVNNEDADMDSVITTFNTAVTETAS